MRDGQGLFPLAHFLAVHPHFGGDVRTFQVEGVHGHSLAFGQSDRSLIPRLAHIVLVWGEEELQLHVLSWLTVLLHVRVEEITGVVERAHPLGVHADVVALQPLWHRGRQRDLVFELSPNLIPLLGYALTLTVHLELPRAAQVDNLCLQPRCCTKEKGACPHLSQVKKIRFHRLR